LTNQLQNMEASLQNFCAALESTGPKSMLSEREVRGVLKDLKLLETD